MLFQIKGRFDASIKWEGEITVAHNASPGLKLGRAILAALAAGSDLSGSNLSYSDLSGSNLSYSNLSGSDLSGSNLSGSDLSGSNLSGSNLSYSNLSYSNLSGSDLSYSDLSYSDLSYSDLSGETGKVKRLVAVVRRSDGYYFNGFEREDGTLGIVAGCQNRTEDSYRRHTADYDSFHKKAETIAILDYLAAQLARPAWS